MSRLVPSAFGYFHRSRGSWHLRATLTVQPPKGERPVGWFPFERQRGHVGTALVCSAILHALCIVIVSLMIGRAAWLAEAPREAAVVKAPLDTRIVWLGAPSPEGGGGGGGNRSKEPPRRLEVPGHDRISLPVARPIAFNRPDVRDEPMPEQQLTLPAKSLGASNVSMPGDLEGTSVASLSLGPGSGGGAGTGTGTGIGPGRGSGVGPGWGGGAGGGAYRPGSGVQVPRLLRDVKPQYTTEAMRAKIQGTVIVECVVQVDGTVEDVRVVRSLDPTFGLDREAVKAATAWQFLPGTREGRPVPVLITIEFTFTLR